MSYEVPPRPDLQPPGRPIDVAPPAFPPPPLPEDQAAEESRPRATWTWWKAMLVLLAGIFVASLAAVAVDLTLPRSAPHVLVGSIVVDIVVLGVLLLWLRVAHPTWRAVMGFPKSLLRETGAGLVGGLALRFLAIFPVATLLTFLLEAISGKQVEAPAQLGGKLTGLRLIVAILFAVVVAPITEEFFFRGLLFNALRARHRFAVAAGVSGAVFGGIHYLPGPWQDSILLAAVMVFVGFGLAWIYERRRNIAAPMLAHATFNLIGVFVIAFVT